MKEWIKNTMKINTVLNSIIIAMFAGFFIMFQIQSNWIASQFDRIDEQFKEIRAEIGGLRIEIGEIRKDVTEIRIGMARQTEKIAYLETRFEREIQK